jgi:hypothetical protein
MSEADKKLAALWEADAPPARDAAFRLAVQARLAKRRMQARLAFVALYGAAAVIAVALVAQDATALVSGNEALVAFACSAPAFALGVMSLARRWDQRVRR